jgi:predicted dehydrogenase
MKIMIAGLGSIGRRHLRNLLALGERDILLYRTQRSTLPEDELAGYPVETELEAALAQQPEAVIISNPTALHLEVAIPAARAGGQGINRCLMLEKPVAGSMERIPELESAVRESGARVLVGFHFRYHPGLRRLRELLATGEAGRPLSVRAQWGEYLPGWHPWEDYRQGYSARPDLGGGVVLTLSHPLDYLRWLFGEVEALWAFTGKNSDLELQVEDTAEIGLRFASGVLGSLHLDYNQRPPSHFMEVVTTQGTLRWDNLSGEVMVYRNATGDRQVYPPPVGFERNELFLAEMRHFLQVARGEAEPLCSLADGVHALRLALAVHDSQQQGKLIYL